MSAHQYRLSATNIERVLNRRRITLRWDSLLTDLQNELYHFEGFTGGMGPWPYVTRLIYVDVVDLRQILNALAGYTDVIDALMLELRRFGNEHPHYRAAVAELCARCEGPIRTTQLLTELLDLSSQDPLA